MEIWKDIKGYEGLYQVSSCGNIKSLERVVKNNKFGGKRILPEQLLSPTDNGHGYKLIGLRKNGKRKNHYIHRLVAIAFIPNANNEKYVNHIDYNTANNVVENLEWCSQKENVQYSSMRMKHPHKRWKISNTGEKYIYVRGDKFRLCISNIIDRTFKTIEEAVKAREVILIGEKHFTN